MNIYRWKQYLNLHNVNELHYNVACVSWNVPVAKYKNIFTASAIGDPTVLPHTNSV